MNVQKFEISLIYRILPGNCYFLKKAQTLELKVMKEFE